jgi:hypothetical protein
MSEELRDRLRLKLSLKALDNILSTCKSLNFIGYLEDSETPAANLIWGKIAGFNVDPSQKIPMDLSSDEINIQLQRIIKELNIEHEIYLSIGGMGKLPWVKVKIVPESSWLTDLWEFSHHEFIILNSKKDKAVVLLEEEDCYEMYIVDIKCDFSS